MSVQSILWGGSLVLLVGIKGNELPSGVYAAELTQGRLIQVLKKTSQGSRLIEKAKEKWELTGARELSSYLKWGEISRTRAVVRRQFDPEEGTRKRSREVKVYLNRDQSFSKVVLDLAHELTHAVRRSPWDPYSPELTPTKYIRQAIEKKGGEVDAVLRECGIALELKERMQDQVFERRCGRYFNQKKQKLAKKKLKKDFYRMGSWFEKFLAHEAIQKKDFPLLNAKKARLYSSTGNAPYPQALYEEYQRMTQTACQNSYRRVKLFRSPAQLKSDTQAFLRERCSLSTEDNTALDRRKKEMGGRSEASDYRSSQE